MNERIRELAEQAGEYVNEVYTPPVRSKTPGKIWEDGHVDWHIQFNQKFAELIVRECAELSVNSQYTNTKSEYYEGFNEALIYAGNKIRKHFGIKP